ncbi:MAG: DUF6677 family protein [Phycisphaerales bacterium JB040]
MPDSPPPSATLNLAAGVGAALLPGLGHVLRGETRRGILAGASILFLFFAGILIGGVDVVDSREDRVWFIGQALVGPVAFGVDYLHQEHLKAYGPETSLEDGRSPAIVSRSGRPDETRVWSEANQRHEWRRLTAQELGAGMGPPNTKSVAKVNEIGTLYATLAGMVNLILILDALIVTPRRKRETARTHSERKGDA